MTIEAADGIPTIGDHVSVLETRSSEVSLLDTAIRLKVNEQDPEHKRLGKDNRSWAVSLQVDVAAAIERGLIQTFDGDLPQKPNSIATLNLVAEVDGRCAAYLEIASTVDGESPSIWDVAIASDGVERWGFTRGQEKKKTKKIDPLPGASLNMRRLIDLATHPERTVDSYSRVIDKWAEVAKWGETERSLMQNALRLAIKYLGKEKRKSGEPYTEHLWETARQMWAWGIRDVNELAAALMHDILEDSSAFKPRTKELVENWQRRGRLTIKKELKLGDSGDQAAYLTMMMSRPPRGVAIKEQMFKFNKYGKRMYKIRLLSDRERNDLYYEQIESSQPIRRIKIPDRLHNVRTLWAMPDENIVRTYLETKARYPKLIARIRQENPALAKKQEEALDSALSEYDELVAAATFTI